MAGKSFSFAEERELIEQILQQAEGTQPAAYKASEQTSEEEENPQRRKGNLIPPLIQQRLKRSYGAGGDGPGTGIAVKAGHTGIFCFSLINFSVQKAVDISVCKGRIKKLYSQSYFSHKIVTRFRYIPDKS